MAVDWPIKQGETLPTLTDSLTYANGEKVDLTGATVGFAMRGATATTPLALTGATAIRNAGEGKIEFLPTAADTAVPGFYTGNWQVTFVGATTPMSFPTDGYISILIEANVTAETKPTALVGLPEIKEYLFIPPNDRTQDQRLKRLIDAITPLIENMTGPILPHIFRERYDGGQYFISLRRRPSSTYGTSPILRLVSVSEWRGPIEYTLAIIQDPAHGSLYSCMLDERTGTVTRRTSGGGVIAFPPMAQSVQVIYEAGQEYVPANVAQAALEAVRVNWQRTMAVGRGAMTRADEEDVGPPMGFFLPRRVKELLNPTRRAPAVA